MAHHVYILRCNDGSYYVGHTTDLVQREAAHTAGVAAKHTACRRPVRIVYSEEHASELAAIERELQIKKWTRAKKEALITGNRASLRALSRSRD